jgi:hypothetical protein
MQTPWIRRGDRRGKAAALLLFGAAVLLALLIVVLARLRAPGPSVGAKYLVSPVGPVPQADAFVWKRPKGAVKFFFELLDQGGTLLWSQTTRDTTLLLPTDLMLNSNRVYRWRVTYTYADGVSMPTNDESFQVSPPPRGAR